MGQCEVDQVRDVDSGGHERETVGKDTEEEGGVGGDGGGDVSMPVSLHAGVRACARVCLCMRACMCVRVCVCVHVGVCL